MEIYSEQEIKNMTKEELIIALIKSQDEYKDLYSSYNNLDDDYAELEIDNSEMADRLDDLESQIQLNNELVDMNYLKEKLELYGFKTEELWNFLDDYMRLYNN